MDGNGEGRELLLISGMSGAGKGTASKVLEEFGWYVVDNLPLEFVGELLERMQESNSEPRRLAIVVDVRSLGFDEHIAELLESFHGSSQAKVLFLDASDEALVKRFNNVRRSHPLQSGDGLVDGIERERKVLEGIRGLADVVVDTTTLSVHDLRHRLETPFGELGFDFHLTVESFGFKYGVPVDVDMLLDMRFLPNPHWIPELQPYTGREKPVQDYVLADESIEEYLRSAVTMINLAITGYRREGKRYMTIAVGCTGGKHRSVAISESLAGRLSGLDAVDVHVRHRDLGRE
ncbi:RNase adapter RapZ [Rhodococcus sp. IEGM 1408]|uniref:RNase adapter RapZ n=1 Tax=Rhodococcus sp. IEGM 1408 TaxID=3082220 RepID=UPI002953578E|nr:RNase adapter RapZ [Rhodococcus sp. IEGM 1408]MDV8000286.1 RNase adapter RapZ [Rhodococcus sp. IEGM 1408]